MEADYKEERVGFFDETNPEIALPGLGAAYPHEVLARGARALTMEEVVLAQVAERVVDVEQFPSEFLQLLLGLPRGTHPARPYGHPKTSKEGSKLALISDHTLSIHGCPK